VVLYHAGLPWLPGGFVGVDVFFVLSGFLITGLMVSEVAKTGRLSLVAFYARRIRRLLPAAVTVLVVTAAASAVILPATQRAQVAGDIRAAGLYLSNWRFASEATDYWANTDTPSPVLHYWSLGVEEQFYILWPVLIVLCVLAMRWVAKRLEQRPQGTMAVTPNVIRASLGVVIALIAYFSYQAGVSLTASNESLAFFNTFTRIWELALGAVVAVVGMRVLRLPYGVRGGLAWIGVLALAWCLFTYDSALAWPGRAAAVPVIATALIVIGCTARTSSRPGPAKLLSVAPMRHVGRISYSWYLWHWPLLVLPAVALGHGLTFVQATVAVAVSYLLAVATYRYIETPLRFAPSLKANRPALIFGVALTALAVLAAGALARSAQQGVELTGLVGNTSEVSGDVFQAAPGVTVNMGNGKVSVPPVLTPSVLEAPDDHFADLYDQGCQAGYDDVKVVDCAFGDVKSDKTMVVFGDSHASAWAAGLDVVAVERGWKLVPISKGRCSAATYPVYVERFNRPYDECDTWRAAALERIKELKPDLVIIANRWYYQVAAPDGTALPDDVAAPLIAAGTADMAKQLRSTGAKVIFLRDFPAPGFTGPTCVAENLDDYSACDFSRADQWPRDDAILSAVDAVKRVRVVDINATICDPAGETCPVVADNILRYRDDSHISATYARILAPALGQALGAYL
jgi:peptidoglycan/LPS O-acetylase OafA/YrhL